MGHGHCHRQYIDYQDNASWAMAIVTDNTLTIKMLLHGPYITIVGDNALTLDAASWAMAMVRDSSLINYMLLHGP